MTALTHNRAASADRGNRTLSSRDGRSWRDGAAPPESTWRHEIPPELVGDARSEFSSSTRAFISGVIESLESGPGFAVLDRLPTARLGYRLARSSYLRLGTGLGVPIPQDKEGTLLYDLIDTTPPPVAEPDYVGSRRDDLPFHTDNAWGRIVPDYVGILCLRGARNGGELQLVSAYSVLEKLDQASPTFVEALRVPLSFDPTRQLQPGEDAEPMLPVVAGDRRGELTLRYLRYQVADEALSRDQRAAIAALEATLHRPELRLRLALEPGQILLVNNRWVLHNRTRYHNTRARPRWHVRLWLERRVEGGGPR